MEKHADFSKGKLFPLILKFSIPASISLLITAIYNIVDRIFVGNFVGNTALAALSICFPLSFIMIAFGLMCSAGGSTLFTLFRGKNDEVSANLSFGNAFTMTVIFEVLLTLVLLFFSNTFLKIFGVTETTYDLSLKYYLIVSFGCVFQGLTLVLCDFVRVSGNPILGMAVTGIGAITNIILDAIFVVALGWGVEGAALATVIGQVVSMVFGLYLVFTNRTLVKVNKNIFKINKGISNRVLSCGFAFWIAQIAMGFIALVYNSQLGKYGGDIAISVYAVISSIMTFVIMPASGISQGIQPIIGFNYSAGYGNRVKETFIKASLLSVGVTTVIWVIVESMPALIINTFGGGSELLDIGVIALRLNFIITPVLGFVMLATTFFQSIGKPTASSIITLIRQVVALIPFIFILPRLFDINGIFVAQPISDFIALILSIILIKVEFSNLSINVSNSELKEA
ncbi:MATE family efflux transporter [Clostridium celatum]|nr:MATE family efflux transporter [Clostridium celatum]MCE9654969.1 MATE family efflux transporter [Clostridium celatum]